MFGPSLTLRDIIVAVKATEAAAKDAKPSLLQRVKAKWGFSSSFGIVLTDAIMRKSKDLTLP